MAEHGVAALSHPPSGERVRTGPADPSGAWDQDHPPSTETTTQESGLRENRTSRLSERTEEGRKPDLLRLYSGEANLALLHWDAGGVLLAEEHVPSVRDLKPGDNPQQRCFARTRRAEKRQELARAHLERHPT